MQRAVAKTAAIAACHVSSGVAPLAGMGADNDGRTVYIRYPICRWHRFVAAVADRCSRKSMFNLAVSLVTGFCIFAVSVATYRSVVRGVPPGDPEAFRVWIVTVFVGVGGFLFGRWFTPVRLVAVSATSITLSFRNQAYAREFEDLNCREFVDPIFESGRQPVGDRDPSPSEPWPGRGPLERRTPDPPMEALVLDESHPPRPLGGLARTCPDHRWLAPLDHEGLFAVRRAHVRRKLSAGRLCLRCLFRESGIFGVAGRGPGRARASISGRSSTLACSPGKSIASSRGFGGTRIGPEAAVSTVFF